MCIYMCVDVCVYVFVYARARNLVSASFTRFYLVRNISHFKYF
jgi:hypothetical protein